MNAEELRQQVAIEFESSSRTLANLADLRQSIGLREPTVHELAAFGSYIHNIYNGMENVLKRIARFYGEKLPESPSWHKQLLKLFIEPARTPLPSLLDAELANDLFELLAFRHVFLKRYAAELDWDKLQPLVQKIDGVSARFQSRVIAALSAIK